MALGAVEALKAKGLKNVKVIGYDALPETLKAIQAGDVYGTVEQFPGKQARTGLPDLERLHRQGHEAGAARHLHRTRADHRQEPGQGRARR